MAEFLTHYSIPPWLAYTVVALVECVLLLIVALCSAAVAIWLERKVAARIQDRLGPTRVGGRFGWLQPPADGIKLLCKEDIIPAEADKPLFRIAPYISFCTALCVFIALPFSNGWVALHLDVGIFFILAVSGLEVFGVILGGYASGSKWSLYGAMRESAQVISYEIPMALCVVVPVLIVGSMDLVAIGNSQAGWFWNWLIFHDPFTFATFWIYLTCAIASTNRAPFDLAEAESELVAGFLTEYSGFRWVVYFMAEYPSMFIISGLASILYLGGWNGPIPVASILHLMPETHAIAGWLGNFLGMCNFITKGVVGITCMIWLRWTLPRLRIDQVMTTCLKYCVPLASAMLAGAMLWAYFLPGGLIAQAKQRFMAPSEAEQSVSSDNLQHENVKHENLQQNASQPTAESKDSDEANGHVSVTSPSATSSSTGPEAATLSTVERNSPMTNAWELAFNESKSNARHDASWNCANREGRNE